MVEMGKKTGGHFLWEPLRTELQDTFGALSHVSPDAVFSNINGHQTNPNALSDEETEEGIDTDQVNNGPESTPKSEKAKKQSKGTYLHTYHITIKDLFWSRKGHPVHLLLQFDNLLCSKSNRFLMK